MRLGIKFGLVSTCIIALLVGSVIFFVSADVEEALREENREKVMAIGGHLAEDVANPLLNGKVLTIQEMIDSHKERADYIEYIFVIDFEGRVVAHTFEDGFPKELLDANPVPPGEMQAAQMFSTEDGIVDEGAFRVLQGLDAEVHIGANEKAVQKAVADTNRGIAAIGALFLLIGATLTFFLSYRITRPVQRVVEGMEKIGEGNMDHRIEISSRDEIGKLAASFNDMTEKRKEAEEALQSAYEELKTLDDLKASVVSNVSHELRTPITIIRGALELIPQEDNPKQREILISTAVDALARQNMVIGDLIEAAKKGEVKGELKLEPVELGQVITSIKEEFNPLFQKEKIKVEVQIEDSLPKVLANPGKLGHVLRNLINNAIKFNKEGGSITIKSAEKNDVVETCVSDTGPGIPKDKLDRIFDRLYQIDATLTRDHGGTGLGLAIVKEIVEAYGGKIMVESASEQGSTFCFTLPIYKEK